MAPGRYYLPRRSDNLRNIWFPGIINIWTSSWRVKFSSTLVYILSEFAYFRCSSFLLVVSLPFSGLHPAIVSSSDMAPSTAEFTNFAARISNFARRRISNPASAFSVRRVEIAPDGAYFTRQNWTSDSSPTFCIASFNANIRSASDFCWPEVSRGKKTLLPCCSTLRSGLGRLPFACDFHT